MTGGSQNKGKFSSCFQISGSLGLVYSRRSKRSVLKFRSTEVKMTPFNMFLNDVKFIDKKDFIRTFCREPGLHWDKPSTLQAVFACEAVPGHL